MAMSHYIVKVISWAAPYSEVHSFCSISHESAVRAMHEMMNAAIKKHDEKFPIMALESYAPGKMPDTLWAGHGSDHGARAYIEHYA